ncbi:MAG: hypothetical protein IKO90_04220 [Bacteroidales bacterium]|nr:hypothetical protein [Bacteroidales bacterium]
MLNREIWVNQIKENLYPDRSFLKKVTDFSAFVDADKLHIPSAGIDPEVLINNTTYPITVVERTDNDNYAVLDKFETENTLVFRPETLEYSYDKLESVIKQHRAVLQSSTAKKAAHAFAPQSNTTSTPVIEVSGTPRNGRYTLTLEDILTMKEMFDNALIPTEKRFLILHPKHVSDLLREDIKTFKDITDLKNGEPFRFAGFGIYTFPYMPYYKTENGILTKVSFGEEDPTKDSFASVAFQADEVFKADGELFMYSTENDPKYRGTIIGFDKRFIALPIRGMGIGALVSKASEETPNTEVEQNSEETPDTEVEQNEE